MNYLRYSILLLFILLIAPVVPMMFGFFPEKLLLANLFIQAVALTFTLYGLTSKREKEFHGMYLIYLLLILIYYAIAIMVAGAPIPERGFG